MGHVTYADGVAIYQLIFFVPCFLASLVVAARHGAMKSSGWIFLTIFCLIRIIGSSARIATITNPQSTDAYTTALVCSVLGLSPLLMASLGLISRAYYSMLKQPWSTLFSLVIVKIVHTPAIVALILCIVGATNATSPDQIDSQSTVHIGIILYTVVLAILTLLTLIAWIGHRGTDGGEPLLVAAVICALPFIFIRLLYSLLSVFSHEKKFNQFDGSETIALFMSVLPEMVAATIYIATGLKLEAVPADVSSSSPGRKMVYRAGRGDFGTGKLGMISLAAAAFNAVKENRPQNEEGARQKSEQPRQTGA